MISYQTEVTINSPVEQVFRKFADVEGYTQWMDMSSSRLLSSGPVKAGSQAEGVLKKGPLKMPLQFVISEFEPDRKITFSVTSKGQMQWDASYLLEPKDVTTTRVSTAGTMRLMGWMRLLEPLMAGEVKNGEHAELERLKTLLEKNG